MKLIVIIILILLGIAAMIVAAWFVVEMDKKDPPDGTVITYEDEVLSDAVKDFDNGYFTEIDEYSPEQLDLDKTLKNISLRNKLKEIETKRKKK